MTKLIHFSRQSSFWCVVGDWWILAHFVSFGQVEPGPVAHHVTLDPVPATSDTHLTHPPVWASAAPSGVKIIKKKVFFFTSPFQLVAVFVVTKCFPFSGKCVLCFLWNNLILWFYSGAAAVFLMITGLFLSDCDQTAHRWIALWTFYRKSFGSGWMRPSDGRQIGRMHQGKWRALLPEPDFSWILRTKASPDRLALKNKSVELVETYRFDCKMIAMRWTVAEKIIFNEPQLTSFCCNFF